MKKAHGFTLLEILITMAIVSVGLMGIAAILARLQVSEVESYQRSQALIMLSDITERLNVNRSALSCMAFTTDMTSGTPFIGTAADTGGLDLNTYTCVGLLSHTYNDLAVATLKELNAQLQGAAEVKKDAATGSGAMLGARACVSYDATTEVSAIAGTGTYTITVVWQGLVETKAPPTTSACANGLYGPETQRRAVSTTVRFAFLTQLETGLLAWL
ncbi:MAG: prepilin-type N-terminal cleavage/methylation domain-containing protein [Magnetococcus sp. YQC-5]